MSNHSKNPKYARNKNILVIGGSGKTQFFITLSLMQMHSSYVITNLKGQLLSESGIMLRRGTPKLDEKGKPMRHAHGKVVYEPYRIKVLNTINFEKSMKYNPLRLYPVGERHPQILQCHHCQYERRRGNSSENFWMKTEQLLYCALISYICYKAESEDKDFLTLLELINSSETKEYDKEFQSPVDLLFAKPEKDYSAHFAVKQYHKFKLGSEDVLRADPKTKKSHLENQPEQYPKNKALSFYRTSFF